jgi:hypothetical protein
LTILVGTSFTFPVVQAVHRPSPASLESSLILAALGFQMLEVLELHDGRLDIAAE